MAAKRKGDKTLAGIQREKHLTRVAEKRLDAMKITASFINNPSAYPEAKAAHAASLGWQAADYIATLNMIEHEKDR